jgi:hypothetical protein
MPDKKTYYAWCEQCGYCVVWFKRCETSCKPSSVLAFAAGGSLRGPGLYNDLGRAGHLP